MIRDDSGKLVLESALLFPLILMFTVGAMGLALAVGIHTALYVQADEAAVRASFVWDNSKRNPVTGDFNPGDHDDLYWRITSDFSSSALVSQKLQSTMRLYPSIVNRTAHFTNQIWQRSVYTELHSPFHTPDWLGRWVGVSKLNGVARAIVTDPAEWIRNMDIARSYWPLLKGAITPEQGDAIVDEFRKRPGTSQQPLAFNSHDEARAYLQQLVDGKLSKEDTEEVGKWRMIDALDQNGIAHQAYFGLKTNNKDMRDQMEKDAELLRKGVLKGVTWHFFRRSRDGAIGLSDALRKQVEERGIVIVIHE